MASISVQAKAMVAGYALVSASIVMQADIFHYLRAFTTLSCLEQLMGKGGSWSTYCIEHGKGGKS